MLIEIRCSLFQEKVITFHEGLNAIVGDATGANSIGKSTLLMVIDFVFGGESFIKHDAGVARQLGQQSYQFCFEFDGKRYYFRRDTETPLIVWKCDKDYQVLTDIKIDDYTRFLKEKYLPTTGKEITFRAFVSLFSRIWKKENVKSPEKPLHTVLQESDLVCIDRLLKIFGKYAPLVELTAQLNSQREKERILNKAFTTSLIPKISKKKFKENESQLHSIRQEIDGIKNNLARFALNLKEIVNREVMEMKIRKDRLLEDQATISNKLLRIRQNISDNRHITSKNLTSLVQFFPNSLNSDKVVEIEEFHSTIARMLKSELKKSESEFSEVLAVVDSELKELDLKLASKLDKAENPAMIVDRVYDLAAEWQGASQENKFHSELEALKVAVRVTKENLSLRKAVLVKEVETEINEQLTKTVREVYGTMRKKPVLTLGENSYSFEVVDDTGTGKAFSNLLLFDIAIFLLTDLPILIHDSVLYKNIENRAVENFIKIYAHIHKQSFISIDEIGKYGKSAEILRQSQVIELNNKKLLYIKDWRQNEVS